MDANLIGRISVSILIAVIVILLALNTDKKVLSMKEFKVGSDITLRVINGESHTSSSENFYIPEGAVLKQDQNIYSNTFVIRVKGIYYILGAGKSASTIVKQLKKAKMSPDEIQGILLCDAQQDSIGGLVENGNPVFKNAILYINSVELDWIDNILEPVDIQSDNQKSQEEIASEQSEELKALKTLQKEVIKAYSGHIRRFYYNGAPLFEGVTPMAMAGPTPGHATYLLESGNQKMLLVGNLIQNLNQITYPEMYILKGGNKDFLPDESINSRKDLFELAVSEQITLAGEKLPFPCVGNIISTGDGGYEFSFKN